MFEIYLNIHVGRVEIPAAYPDCATKDKIARVEYDLYRQACKLLRLGHDIDTRGRYRLEISTEELPGFQMMYFHLEPYSVDNPGRYTWVTPEMDNPYYQRIMLPCHPWMAKNVSPDLQHNQKLWLKLSYVGELNEVSSNP